MVQKNRCWIIHYQKLEVGLIEGGQFIIENNLKERENDIGELGKRWIRHKRRIEIHIGLNLLYSLY